MRQILNDKMKKKYCQFCGSKKVKTSTGYYDQDTGKEETELYCVNPNCTTNCNHNFSRFSWGPGNCKNCGTRDVWFP